MACTDVTNQRSPIGVCLYIGMCIPAAVHKCMDEFFLHLYVCMALYSNVCYPYYLP